MIASLRRRRIAIAATGRAEPNLERLAAERIAQARESRRFVGRADVAPHARPVGRQRAYRSTEQRRDRLAGDLTVEIPERGVDPGQRATEERPRELQLRVDDAVVDRVNLADVTSDDRARDQAMQHLGGDIGLVGSNLSPTGLAIARRDADERQRIATERLNRFDRQAARHDRPILVAWRAAQVVVATLAGGVRLFWGFGVCQRRRGRGQRGTSDNLFDETAATAGHEASLVNAVTLASN
jgi:hypothetical protein